MYEDDFLEARYEDLNGFPEDPADFDARDYDEPEEFFDWEPMECAFGQTECDGSCI